MGLFKGIRILLEQCQVKQDEYGEQKELKQENPSMPYHWYSTCEINEKINGRLRKNLEKALQEK